MALGPDGRRLARLRGDRRRGRGCDPDDRRRHGTQAQGVRRRSDGRGRAPPTSSTGGLTTRSCSRSSLSTAAERRSFRTHECGRARPAALVGERPPDAQLPALPGGVRPRSRGGVVRLRRQRLPRSPRRDRGRQRRPLPPQRGGGDPRTGRAVDARLQPLLHRAGSEARGAALDELPRRQGVLLQLRGRSERGGAQARPAGEAAGRVRCPRRRLPRKDARRPFRHSPEREAGSLRSAGPRLHLGVRRPGRHLRCDRARHGCSADRADPGRRGSPPDSRRGPASPHGPPATVTVR